MREWFFFNCINICNYFHPTDLQTHSARSRRKRTKREEEKNAYILMRFIPRTKTWAKTAVGEMRRLKREIGYVIYIAVLLRGTTRGTLESFYAHFFACKYGRFRRESRSRETLVALPDTRAKCKHVEKYHETAMRSR